MKRLQSKPRFWIFQGFNVTSYRIRRILLLFMSVGVFAYLVLLAGCDPITRHKVLSTVFDGVPSLPEPDELCADYVAKGAGPGSEGGEAGRVVAGSTHKPYGEKRCNDCHAQNKSENDGLIRPKQELCFVCHDGIIDGPFVHGPVAVGDCLACHLPHSSTFPSLLRKSPEELCQSCHREDRLAATMHQRVGDRDMVCGECHGPHAGQVRYFLR